jgi:uncharacterized protein with ParB-like and HNH nuclease domain
MRNDKIILDDIAGTKNSLSTDRMDISFGEIMSMYEQDELIVDPEYQRLFRWSNEQQTRFIESLLLGIPIPPIFVAEDEYGKWELVDGVQRISTVLSFFGLLKAFPKKNKWTLTEGDFVHSLKGYNIENLPMKLNLNLKRAACRIEIINWNSKIDMRYELFKRLNTGGSPLTDQEIRNCIFRGQSTEFNNILKKLSEKAEFKKMIRFTDKQKSEKYPEELVLRFSSLVNNYENITESLSIYMTDYMRDAIDNNSVNFTELEELFDRTFHLISQFGREIFIGGNGSFSSSYYDGITIGIARNIDYYENLETKLLRKKIDELRDNKKFKTYMGTGASSKDRVIGRIRIAVEIFTPEKSK